MAEKLTNSQELALRRIMTNAPKKGKPKRDMIADALKSGMSESKIMRNLRIAAGQSGRTFAERMVNAAVDEAKGGFSITKNPILRYMNNNTPGDAIMQLVEKAKGPRLKQKTKAKSKSGPQSTVTQGRASSSTAATRDNKKKDSLLSVAPKKKSPQSKRKETKSWKDYSSIAAAKKDGSLYYNKNGKRMAAVLKEDLKGMSLREYMNKKTGKTPKKGKK